MKRAALGLILLASAAPAAPPIRLSANPSAVVAAEIAFNRLAQEKGQWTAFRETAAKDAVMFVPDMVNAQSWLKGRKDPATSVKWQPEKVIMSCDGGIGVTTGAWQRPDGSTGYFTTIWRRDDKNRWKWVLDHGDTLATPLPAADMITTKLASCPRGKPPVAPAPTVAAVALPGTGRSTDGTLRWTSTVRPDKSRQIIVTLRVGERDETVLTDDVKAPSA